VLNALSNGSLDVNSLITERVPFERYSEIYDNIGKGNSIASLLVYDTEKKKFDEEIDSDGVKMLIDAGAIMHVLGTKMDYVEDDVRSEFVFVNPNAQGTCGCGESFSI
jgi:iron-sulfur cluster assembly accessory protein